MHNVHLTLKSSNVKTGPIPVSTSSRETCPDSCSLKKNGCYADSGPLALHWTKVTSGERGMGFADFCSTIAALPDGQLWRHNQAGDLPGINGVINQSQVAELVRANKGKRGFTYTHYDPSIMTNQESIRRSNRNGFTINLSAECLNEADAFKALNIGPVVTILPIDSPKKLTTKAGNKVIVCPATYLDNVSCATCQLCQHQRDTIIGFPVHGTSKAKAAKVFQIKSI